MRIAESPAVAMITCMKPPSAVPGVDATPAAVPPAIARDKTYNILGPRLKARAKAAKKNDEKSSMLTFVPKVGKLASIQEMLSQC